MLLWPKPNRTFGLVDALGVTGLVGFLVARFIPVARLPFWGCALRRTTGWPCLGCGLTRVADRMSHFNFSGAWEANPLATLAAVGFMAVIGVAVVHMAFAAPVPDVVLGPRETKAFRALLVAAVVINYAFIVIKAKFPSLL